MNLIEMTSPEAAELPRSVVVLLPVGSLEQHGRHLPLFTDTAIADAFAQRVEAALPDRVVRLPAQWVGASAHHLAFTGTVTVRLDTHSRIIVEIIESLLRHGFSRFFVLNGHSGNIDTVRVAIRQLKIDWPDGIFAGASYWDLAKPEIAAVLSGPRKEIGHSDEVETSLMLALHPETVRLDRIRDDPMEIPEALRGATVVYDFDEVTETGQIGHASHARAETGERILEAVTRRLIEAVDALHRLEWRGA